MKKLTIFLCAITITTVAFAQKSDKQNSGKSSKKVDMKEGVLIQDGKTWYIRKMTGDMNLDNGVKASTDGTVKLPNGKIFTLSDGDCVNFQGEMVGLNQKLSTVDGIVTKQNGVMWVRSVLSKPLLLKNGTYANADGTIRETNGSFVKMKDKDFVDMDGNMSSMTK